MTKTNLVAIPCPNCGAELYDGHRKYHMDDSCTTDPCYDFKNHYSKGTYCWSCDFDLGENPESRADEHRLLFGDAA